MSGKSYESTIEEWFRAVVEDGGIERLDDLHIDQIDDVWRPSSEWIAGALQSFEAAIKIRNAIVSDGSLVILLSIPLQDAIAPEGVTFHTCDDLKKSLSYTPPSLYVLRSDHPWIRQMREAKKMNISRDSHITLLNTANFFDGIPETITCTYSESKRPEDEEYSRYVSLAG